MIANLFEEYKFFPKYPERQLKIAAVLFGSLIKHQLVTHLTLGIALRAVLDTLRKPADSKMFGFGTKALEKFVDRLIEWPQYCNHILQISHLRGTHSELVALIERALTRISSGTPELDVGHVIATDQHHGSIPAAHVEGSDPHKVVVIGDTIGDPLKDIQAHHSISLLSSWKLNHSSSLPSLLLPSGATSIRFGGYLGSSVLMLLHPPTGCSSVGESIATGCTEMPIHNC